MAEPSTRQRVHRSRAQWREIVRNWKDSGLSIRAFCQREGISQGSFYAWKKRARANEAAQASGFVELNVAAPGSEPVVVGLPNGVTVAVPARFDEAALRRIVAVAAELSR